MFLDKSAKKKIVDAITKAEHETSGEIRVHISSRAKQDALEEARKVFHRLGMHRTEHRNGVLIFIAPKTRTFAILGDKAIHEKVGDHFWNSTRDTMASHFSKNQIAEGILAGVASAGGELKRHFPGRNDGKNELPDEVTFS